MKQPWQTWALEGCWQSARLLAVGKALSFQILQNPWIIMSGGNSGHLSMSPKRTDQYTSERFDAGKQASKARPTCQ